VRLAVDDDSERAFKAVEEFVSIPMTVRSGDARPRWHCEFKHRRADFTDEKTQFELPDPHNIVSHRFHPRSPQCKVTLHQNVK